MSRRYGILTYSVLLLLFPNIRVSNAVPFKSIQFSINNHTLFAPIPSQQLTSYLNFAAGTYDISFKVIETSHVITKTITIAANQWITFAAIGEDTGNSTLDMIAFTDEGAAPSSQNAARVRFINLSPDSPNVDMRVDNGDEWFNNVAYKGNDLSLNW